MCLHMFSCTCLNYTKIANICKHIHAVWMEVPDLKTKIPKVSAQELEDAVRDAVSLQEINETPGTLPRSHPELQRLSIKTAPDSQEESNGPLQSAYANLEEGLRTHPYAEQVRLLNKYAADSKGNGGERKFRPQTKYPNGQPRKRQGDNSNITDKRAKK